MGLLITKNGKQLGPYTLDEARAMVLAGKLSATDWAWPDGATTWMALKDIPGFATVPGPAAAGVSSVPLSSNEEQELWSGHPSQIINLKSYMLWSVPLAAVIGLGTVWHVAWYALLLLAPVCLIHLLLSYLHTRSIKYVITTQRVRLVRGLFSQDIQEIELFRVEDTAVHQSLFLRLLGLGNITIISGDQRNPMLVLLAIPEAVQLRERLRHEVMNLRQRLGIRPLDVLQPPPSSI